MECKKIGHCGVGEARITNGYNLKAKHVIHTVGPIWHGGNHMRIQYLFNCYKKSLLLATPSWYRIHRLSKRKHRHIRLSKELAAEIAIAAVKQHQSSGRRLKEVIFCCFDDENFQLYDGLLTKD